MRAEVYEALGEILYTDTLPNGLQLMVLPRPEYSRQFAFFATRYGGMDLRFREGGASRWMETPAGIAHFLEHQMFDTQDGTALKILGANGASDNAFTAAHLTGYYFEGTQGFEENLRTLLRFVSVPDFTPESVAKEQGIIAQEIRMCDDDPGDVVYDQLLQAMYVNHPIRVPVVGTLESISGLTPEMLYQCHGAFYRPENMVLCVAGQVDPHQVAVIARQVLPTGGAPAVEVDLGGEEPQGVARRFVERTMPVAVPLFEIGIKGDPAPPGEGMRQELTAQLTCDILLGPSSPLYRRLYEQGLINGVFDSFYDAAPGCAHILAGGESRKPERVLEAVLEQSAWLIREGIDPGLWERQKRACYGGMVRRLNSLENACIDLAQSWVEGEEYLDFPRVFQRVGPQDAMELLQRWFTKERISLSVILPQDGAEQSQGRKETQ